MGLVLRDAASLWGNDAQVKAAVVTKAAPKRMKAVATPTLSQSSRDAFDQNLEDEYDPLNPNDYEDLVQVCGKLWLCAALLLRSERHPHHTCVVVAILALLRCLLFQERENAKKRRAMELRMKHEVEENERKVCAWLESCRATFRAFCGPFTQRFMWCAPTPFQRKRLREEREAHIKQLVRGDAGASSGAAEAGPGRGRGRGRGRGMTMPAWMTRGFVRLQCNVVWRCVCRAHTVFLFCSTHVASIDRGAGAVPVGLIMLHAPG